MFALQIFHSLFSGLCDANRRALNVCAGLGRNAYSHVDQNKERVSVWIMVYLVSVLTKSTLFLLFVFFFRFFSSFRAVNLFFFFHGPLAALPPRLFRLTLPSRRPRTALLLPGGGGLFRYAVLSGYPRSEGELGRTSFNNIPMICTAHMLDWSVRGLPKNNSPRQPPLLCSLNSDPGPTRSVRDMLKNTPGFSPMRNYPVRTPYFGAGLVFARGHRLVNVP